MSAGAMNQFDRNLDAFLGPTVGARQSLSARRELVLVGHLPVMSGLWLSQYADREARSVGPTCLVRLEQDAVQLELFRVGAKRPTISSQASLTEALRAIAPVVSSWLIVPCASDRIEIEASTSSVVVLTGADDMAVITAYGLVKSCVERLAQLPPLSTRPSVRVAVLGADDEHSAAVGATLKRATQAFLNVDLEVRGGLQRVAPVESAFRGTFDAPTQTAAQIVALIKNAEAFDAPHASPVTSPVTTPLIAQVRPPFIHTNPADRFSARSERVGPRGNAVQPVRSEESLPFREAPRSARASLHAEMPTRSAATAVTLLEPVVTAATVMVTPTSSSSSTSTSASSSTLASTSASTSTSSPTQSVTPTPRGIGLAPEPSLLRCARAVESALPELLTPHLDGLTAIPFRAPRAKHIEIACDNAGRLHVVASGAHLASLLEVRAWIREHRELLHAAVSAFTSTDDALLDVVYASHRDATAIDGARVHVFTLVELGGHRGYLAQCVSE